MDNKPDYEDVAVPEDEKALVKKYSQRIDAARSRNEKRFQRYEINRKYYRGAIHKDGSTGLVRTNLIFSTIASVYPQIYAKNPDISMSPGEAASEESYEQVKQFGKTANAVLDRLMVRGAQLKRRIKSQIRAGMITEVGWLKVTYQKNMDTDPIIRNRMDDMQDNIKRLQAAAEKDLDSGMDYEANIAEVKAQIAALQPNLEVVVSSGIVIDKLKTEDLLVLDPTIQDFDEYPNASAICQMIWMDEDTYEKTFGRKATKKAQRWFGKDLPKSAEPQTMSKGEGESCFLCVREIWAKSANTIYTHCEGEEGWCREPYNPQRVGKRWYPFFGLCFNPVDGEFYGLSDVELLIELQEEYSRTRTGLAEHRKYSIPIRVVRAGGSLSPEDVDNLKKAKWGDTVVIGGDSSVPLQNDVTILQGAPVDPAVYDVTPIRADVEMVSGASDAARGNVLKPKTATEAEIMQQGLAGRTAERQDTIEDMIQEMAEYCLQLCIKELTIPEVMKIAGQKSVWPTEPTDDALDTLRLEIRAGSSGKPDQAREREQWIQLMPIIQQAMEKVMMLRQSGMNDMADAVVELTRESLRRFDERIDIDSFLPRKKEGEVDPQALQMEAQQKDMELQQMQQAMQELVGQLQQAQGQLQDKQAEREHAAGLEREKIQSGERVATQTTNAKAMESALADAIAQTKQVQARLQRLEQAVQTIPEPVEQIDKNEIMLEVRDMLDRLKPEAPEAPEPQEPPVINITVPVTIEGKGSTRKVAKAIKQADGSYIMQAIEAPEEDGVPGDIE